MNRHHNAEGTRWGLKILFLSQVPKGPDLPNRYRYVQVPKGAYLHHEKNSLCWHTGQGYLLTAGTPDRHRPKMPYTHR